MEPAIEKYCFSHHFTYILYSVNMGCQKCKCNMLSW